MIDFRFHLVSIVAVFLALGVGIVTGSGFLGQALLRDLRERVAQVRERNDDLQALVGDLEQEIEASRDFAEQVRPLLIEPGSLSGSAVVLVDVEGTRGTVVDGVRGAIEEAGARIPLRLTLTSKFVLATDAELDQLALILRSTETDTGEVLAQTGTLLGESLAVLARGGGQTGMSQGRASRLFDELQEAGFIVVEREGGSQRLIPNGAMFATVAGGDEDRRFDIPALVTALSAALEQGGAEVVVAEPATSTWMVVQAIRASDAAEEVATVDHADTVVGHIAIVLALDPGRADPAGHYGRDAGAVSVIPQPSPTSL